MRTPVRASHDLAEPLRLFPQHVSLARRTRPQGQLLKWVGNKHRYAEVIARHLPAHFGRYFEPFVGTGAVLATLQPASAVASDTLGVLVDFFRIVQTDPAPLISHYASMRKTILTHGRDAYESIRARFNEQPNAADLLVLSRTCYGGVVRFTRAGALSTPMGPHQPMSESKLARYMDEWQYRIQHVEFAHQDFAATMELAGPGDAIYCDPPYLHGQKILYGAQDFQLARLWKCVRSAVSRGAYVAVSVDGYRRSGARVIDLGVPEDLFARELLIDRGGCMLRRFQMMGLEMAAEGVADRLLLSW